MLNLDLALVKSLKFRVYSSCILTPCAVVENYLIYFIVKTSVFILGVKYFISNLNLLKLAFALH